VLTVAIAVVATLLFSWATWALFIAPRDGGDTIEGFVKSMAGQLREGDFDSVREHLDPSFTFNPGGLDRDAALLVARNELAAGRFQPYVASIHAIPGGTGEVEHIAVLGVLARGEPEKMRDVPLQAFRIELKVKEVDRRYAVLSAQSHLGR
jgi:hypothetical protein